MALTKVHGAVWDRLENLGSVNALELVTSGAGTDGDPYLGWDSDLAVLSAAEMVIFPPGVFATTGVLIDGQTKHCHWRGAGMGDVNTGQPTVIKGLTDGGANAYIIKANSVRYVKLCDMALDADGVKESCLIVDATAGGVSGVVGQNVYMHEATLRTCQLGPTPSVQVDQSAFTNCWFVSLAPSDSQLYVDSSNAIDLSFYTCAFAGGGPYNIHIRLGVISLYDCVFSSATTADIFFATESCVIFVNRAHTESVSRFFYAPAAVPVAGFAGVSSRLFGVNHAAVPTAPNSVEIGQGRAVEIQNCFFPADVVVTAPATVYVTGPLTFGNKSSLAITMFADAGGGMTTVTSNAHGLTAPAIVSITGTTNYNGLFNIEAVTANTFDIAVVFVANDGTGTWGEKAQITGTGTVSRAMSANDPVSLDASGANSPHIITNRLGVGTALTTGMLNGDVYMPDLRGLRWAKKAGNDFGGKFCFKHIDALAINGIESLATGATGAPNALIFITNNNAQMAVFALRGGLNAVVEMLDASSAYSDTALTASMTNIYYDGGNARYELENRTGAIESYQLWYMSPSA